MLLLINRYSKLQTTVTDAYTGTRDAENLIRIWKRNLYYPFQIKTSSISLIFTRDVADWNQLSEIQTDCTLRSCARKILIKKDVSTCVINLTLINYKRCFISCSQGPRRISHTCNEQLIKLNEKDTEIRRLEFANESQNLKLVDIGRWGLNLL